MWEQNRDQAAEAGTKMHLDIEYFYNQIIQPAYTSWKNGFSSDMLVEMSIFVPVQALNFTIIKPHFRVPFLTCFGFLWVMTLSYRRGIN